VVLIESFKKRGFVENHNELFTITADLFDYILVLNNDTILDKDAIKRLILSFKFDNKLGIVGPQLYFLDGTLQNSGSNLTFLSRTYTILKLRDVINNKNKIFLKKVFTFIKKRKSSEESTLLYKDCISGASMLIKSEVLRKIGYFDNKLYMYGEDNEYCIRAQNNGFRNAIVKNSKVIHIHSPKYNYIIFYHILYGLFYLIQKYNYSAVYYSFLTVILYLRYVPIYLFSIKSRPEIKNIIKIPLKIKKNVKKSK